VQFTAWNLGNGAVMAGTLAGITSLVDTGGALLIDLNLHAESVKSVLGRAPVKHRGIEAGFLVVRLGGRLTACSSCCRQARQRRSSAYSWRCSGCCSAARSPPTTSACRLCRPG